MKRLITLLAVLVAFTIFAMSTYAKPPDPYAMPVEVVNEATSPVPVTVVPPNSGLQPSPIYEFVGYAGASSGANDTLPERHALCQATFGDRARMSTTEEYVLSPNATPPPTAQNDVQGFAWILPTLIAPNTDLTGNQTTGDSKFLGYCGASVPSPAGAVLAAVNQYGEIVVAPYGCGADDVFASLACSAPVQ